MIIFIIFYISVLLILAALFMFCMHGKYEFASLLFGILLVVHLFGVNNIYDVIKLESVNSRIEIRNNK